MTTLIFTLSNTTWRQSYPLPSSRVSSSCTNPTSFAPSAALPIPHRACPACLRSVSLGVNPPQANNGPTNTDRTQFAVELNVPGTHVTSFARRQTRCLCLTWVTSEFWSYNSQMDSSKAQQPSGVPQSSPVNLAHPPSSSSHAPRRRKNHRAGRKKNARRKSFAVPLDEIAHDSANSEGLDEMRQSFYSRPSRNLSNTSIDSETLLDHRWVLLPSWSDVTVAS